MTHADTLTAWTSSAPSLGLSHDLVAFIEGGVSGFHIGSFRTKAAFRRFCRRFGLTLTPSESPWQHDDVKAFRLKETFCDNHLVADRSEVPSGARRFLALSNGSIVTCWWKRDGDRIDIYRPNPNAKAIYRPLPLERHIAFQKRNGIY